MSNGFCAAGLVLCVATAAVQGQPRLVQREWYDGDRRAVVWMAVDQVAAVLDPGVSPQTRDAVESGVRAEEPTAVSFKKTANAVFFEIAGGHDMAARRQRLRAKPGVAFVSPVFYSGSVQPAQAMALTGEIIVGFSAAATDSAVAAFAKAHHVKLVRRFDAVPNTYIFDARASEDVLDLANSMRHAAGVAFAVPNWIQALTRR